MQDSPASGPARFAVHSLRSSFGHQPVSTRYDSPSMSFGSSVRATYQRVYVSPEQDKALCRAAGGNNSQGPGGYKLPDGLGRQPISTRASAPTARFGSAERVTVKPSKVPGPGSYKVVTSALDEQIVSLRKNVPRIGFGTSDRDDALKVFISAEHEKGCYGRESPGPCAYKPVGGPALQVLSDKHSTPAWRMGTGQRASAREQRRAAEIPGAGAYNPRTQDTLGRQLLSTRRSSATVRFGTSTRDQAARVAISKEHDKGGAGRDSPGPGTAGQNKGVGAQVLSTKKNLPSWRFSTSKRDHTRNHDTPGPGEYWA